MSQTLLSLAGFQVILIGRFWVIAEVKGRLRRFEPLRHLDVLWLVLSTIEAKQKRSYSTQ